MFLEQNHNTTIGARVLLKLRCCWCARNAHIFLPFAVFHPIGIKMDSRERAADIRLVGRRAYLVVAVNKDVEDKCCSMYLEHYHEAGRLFVGSAWRSRYQTVRAVASVDFTIYNVVCAGRLDSAGKSFTGGREQDTRRIFVRPSAHCWLSQSTRFYFCWGGADWSTEVLLSMSSAFYLTHSSLITYYHSL